MTSALHKACLLVSSLSISILMADSVNACSCREPEPCKAFGSSAVVFVGRVVHGEEKVHEVEERGKRISLYSGKCRFVVEEAFKGITTLEVTITVDDMKGTSCGGTTVGLGERYLVYAYNSSRYGLAFGACSATKEISRAADDLAFLRNLPPVGSGGRFSGHIWIETRNEPLPGSGVTVVLRDSDKKEFRTTSNARGTFEFIGLKEGQYRIDVILPENHRPKLWTERNRIVRVYDRGCSEAFVGVTAPGRINGKVTDSLGRSAPLDLYLVAVDDEAESVRVGTNNQGDYEFHEVLAGSYRLFATLVADNTEKDFYFPGTFEKTEAGIITIGPGDRRWNVNLVLPSSIEIAMLSGVVRTAAGSPVTNAEVGFLLDDQSSRGGSMGRALFNPVSTREDGRFTVSLYKGVAYIVRATLGTTMVTRRLLLTEDTREFELILDEKGK